MSTSALTSTQVNTILGHLLNSYVKQEDAPCSATTHFAQALCILSRAASPDYKESLGSEYKDALNYHLSCLSSLGDVHE